MKEKVIVGKKGGRRMQAWAVEAGIKEAGIRKAGKTRVPSLDSRKGI
jgi:hypothetical protein